VAGLEAVFLVCWGPIVGPLEMVGAQWRRGQPGWVALGQGKRRI